MGATERGGRRCSFVAKPSWNVNGEFMTLSLNHQGRINLSAMVGMIECRTTTETRAAWRLMDRLILTEDEKREIEFQPQFINGNETATWNPLKSLPPIQFE